MGRFFGVMAFAAVARLLGPAPVLAEEPSAIGIIKVRQEVDGAGPSNVFRLQRNIVVLADPLKADIKAYDIETKAALGSCGMPRDFKPWRLVRSRDAVSIVDEAERSTIEIPRARAFGPRCRLNVRPYNAARDGYHRLRRVDNRTIAVPSRRWERGRPLTVRAAAFELLSVRELERDAAGNRYVLAKVLQPKDKARAGQIGVAVTVLRYDRWAGSTAPTGCHSRTARSAPSTTWRCCPRETSSSRSMTRPRTSSGSTASRCLMSRVRRKASFRRMCRMRPRRTVSRWRPKRSPPAISPGRRRSPTPSRAARQRARSYRRAADLRSSPRPASIWIRLGNITPRRHR